MNFDFDLYIVGYAYMNIYLFIWIVNPNTKKFESLNLVYLFDD